MRAKTATPHPRCGRSGLVAAAGDPPVIPGRGTACHGGAEAEGLGRRLTRLTPERLAQLIGDLEELLDRYGDPDDDGVPIGVLHVIHPSSRRIP